MIEAQKKETPSLFELTDDFRALMDFGYEPEEEEAFTDTLNMIMESIEDKADGYCAVINRFDFNVQMIKAEEERLKVRKEAIERRIDRMKEALKQTLTVMKENGIEKSEIKTALHTIKLAGNGGKQPMEVNKEKVPKDFTKTTVIVEPDNDKIRKALEEGKELDFAELKPRGTHITIK